jgi:hypothetical protein
MSDRDTPPRLVSAFDELLKTPERTAARSREGGAGGTPWAGLLVGSAVLCALYGAAAGSFQGGAQIAIAAFKAPLIALGSLALCVPSLYVFSALAGARFTPRGFLENVAGFAALLTLVLVGLLPIGWLFSVGSRSRLLMVWFHVVAWSIALAFGHRFLSFSVGEGRPRAALVLWTGLLALVSFQLATQLRPVLWRPEGGAVFESGKRFFTEQLGRAADRDAQAEKAGR